MFVCHTPATKGNGDSVRMPNDTKSNHEWDVFAENHFLGRVKASDEKDALATGIRLFGSHLEGILRVQRRVQTVKDGWSRPI